MIGLSFVMTINTAKGKLWVCLAALPCLWSQPTLYDFFKESIVHFIEVDGSIE